jgi:hypothetical protein
MTISTQNRKALAKSVQKQVEKKSLWKGPCSSTPLGGITYSTLSRFINCRERFRLAMVEGLQPIEEFDYKTQYGNVWHEMEECLAHPTRDNWKETALKYCAELFKKYPMSGKEIDKLYNCVLVQFPIYCEYWSTHEDVKRRIPLQQEQVFNVPYTLPNGRIVYIKGKRDSVDVIDKKLFVQENKSKSDIDEEGLRLQLPHDLQSNLYLITLEIERQANPELGKYPIGGVRYNVIRRPLSGMKFNIKQKKGLGKARKGAETKEVFYDRLGKLIKENAKQFFCRLKMEVDAQELVEFRRKCLDPYLTQLVMWWDSIKADPFNPWYTQVSGKNGPMVIPNPHHWYHPSGVYNPSLEGRSQGLDQVLQTGNTRGLQRRTELFSELK